MPLPSTRLKAKTVRTIGFCKFTKILTYYFNLAFPEISTESRKRSALEQPTVFQRVLKRMDKSTARTSLVRPPMEM